MHAPCPVRMLPQSGAAAIETTLSILLMLLLATAILEFSYWGVVRQLCQLALHESMRIAVAEHGTQHALEQAFVSVHHSRLTQPWSLRIVQPDTNTVMDFQEPFLSAQHGQAVIRNDSQREQHHRMMSQWPEGRGPASGKTIYQANVIVVELTYQHRLITPWFRQWLGSAKTRVTHQAAMQSDFHASPGNSQGRYMVDVVEPTPRYFQESPPPSTNQHEMSGNGTEKAKASFSARVSDGKTDWDRVRQLQEHKPYLMPQQIESNPLSPVVNTRQMTPLHHDLAEQCGSFMCCTNP